MEARYQDMITGICIVTKVKEGDWKQFLDNSNVASIYPNGRINQRKHLTMNHIIFIAGGIIT